MTTVVSKVSENRNLIPASTLCKRPSHAAQRNISSMPAARLGLHVPQQRPGRVGEVAQAHRQLPDAHKDRLPVNTRNVTLESLHATMH